jgi:hypothetical protein
MLNFSPDVHPKYSLQIDTLHRNRQTIVHQNSGWIISKGSNLWIQKTFPKVTWTFTNLKTPDVDWWGSGKTRENDLLIFTRIREPSYSLLLTSGKEKRPEAVKVKFESLSPRTPEELQKYCGQTIRRKIRIWFGRVASWRSLETRRRVSRVVFGFGDWLDLDIACKCWARDFAASNSIHSESSLKQAKQKFDWSGTAQQFHFIETG